MTPRVGSQGGTLHGRSSLQLENVHILHGEIGARDVGFSTDVSDGHRLNPRFVRSLMGYPPGWLASLERALATRSSPS